MIPLVMVHGFMGGSEQWQQQVVGLPEQFDLVCVDLPGFGLNAHLPPLSRIGDYALWVIQHVRLLGIQRYHLLGHSMGGMIAQEIALRDAARIERLVLYATGSVGVLPGRFESIETSKKRAREDGPRATARRIAATWFDQREAAAGHEPCAKIAECSSATAIQAGLDAMEAWRGEDKLSRIETECLVIWGDRDRTYKWEQIEKLWTLIPRACLGVGPGCAHAVHAEKPHIFNALLSDFLAP